ncbi:hypothetical protein CHS0354_042563 [Potamilus streckersoni]|uniref:Mitochondrial import receptor subunit TOM20-like protein n=1 Tax=Potamilus streckersoni TaxID=2493646 RepID=A0AAE0TDZ5_9BIVA|nr:hypothetical protein CHS0354_042563 [Potamilus streckersoni]
MHRSLGIAAAGVGLCFLGYCIYFDQKRRSDPLFKQKLIEKRKKAKQNQKKSSSGQFPDLSNPETRQKFFLQEIQVAEEFLEKGDSTAGVEHLSNAVAACSQPQQLLMVLQQTLPPQVYHMLIDSLPAAGERLASAVPGMGGMGILEEEDVE